MLQVIEAQEEMPILSAVTLYSSLLKFTLHVHPDRLDYADQVLVSFLIATVFNNVIDIDIRKWYTRYIYIYTEDTRVIR